MFFNALGSLMYQGCLWLTTVLVVILSSGYNDSGLLAFAMTVGNMFNPIATYNMRPYQVSDVKGDYSQNNYVAFRLVTLIIGFIIIIPYTFVLSNDVLTICVVLIYLLFKADEAFCDVLYGVEQRAERMDFIGISLFLRGVVLVIAFSVGLFLSKSLPVAVAVMSLSCMAVTFLYDFPHASWFADLRPCIRYRQVLILLKSCLPLVMSTLFIGMVVSLSRQCFSNLYGTEELGRYAAVATPAVLVQAAARYLYAPVLAPLSVDWNKGGSSFRKSFMKTAALMCLCCTGMVIVLSVVGGPLLMLVYGSGISDCVYLFPWVLVGTALIAFFCFVTDTLIVCRNLRCLLVSATVAIIITAVTMLPFERLFGMNGINYTIISAASIGIVVACFSMFWSIRKHES